MGTRMCHCWWGVAARLLPWALSSCERAQLLLLGLAEASSELPSLAPSSSGILGSTPWWGMKKSNIKLKKKLCSLIQVVHSAYDQNPHEAAGTAFAS